LIGSTKRKHIYYQLLARDNSFSEQYFLELSVCDSQALETALSSLSPAISTVMAATTNIETEAFVVEEPNAPFKLTPIILDEMRDDEFLIEMKYSGICHTVRTTWPQRPHRSPSTSNRSSSGKLICFLA
jgi:hypothetical protein